MGMKTNEARTNGCEGRGGIFDLISILIADISAGTICARVGIETIGSWVDRGNGSKGLGSIQMGT